MCILWNNYSCSTLNKSDHKCFWILQKFCFMDSVVHSFHVDQVAVSRQRSIVDFFPPWCRMTLSLQLLDHISVLCDAVNVHYFFFFTSKYSRTTPVIMTVICSLSICFVYNLPPKQKSDPLVAARWTSNCYYTSIK